MDSDSDTCYFWRGIEGGGNEILVNDQQSPCGVRNETHPRVPCCWRGHTCLSDGICQNPDSLEGGSGYAAAGCTDEEFGQGCRSLCINSWGPDVVYVDNGTERAWHCCRFVPGESLDCSNPTPETFLAAAPEDLISIVYLPKSGTPTYPTETPSNTINPSSTQSTLFTTSTTSASNSISDAPSSSAPSNGGLSTGAKAGIGVGAALGGLLLLGLVGFLLYKRRRKGSPPADEPQLVDYKPAMMTYAHELNEPQQLVELEPERPPAELPTSPK